jgi:hypothetical protein
MNKIIIALIGLALVATPALASGISNDIGTINTYFTNDGLIASYQQGLVLNGGHQYTTDSVFVLGKSDLTVLQGTTLDSLFGTTTANQDTWINYDKKGILGSASIDTGAVWNPGAADIFREGSWTGATAIVHAGAIGTGAFADNIDSKKDVIVYTSVGLNQFASCDFPPTPTMPPIPTCTFCALR